MLPAAAARELARLKSIFILLLDIPAIYPLWEALSSSIALLGNRRMMLALSPRCMRTG